MKRLLIAMLLACVIAGCNGKKPVPASRLVQSAGGFSFVTPDGWYRTKLPGIAFTIVSTDSDYGASPNIFVDGAPRSDMVSNSIAQTTQVNRDEIRAYAVLRQETFSTEAGLNGMKVIASRTTKEALPVALFHYFVQDGDRVIVITCSCADSVKQKYEPIFNMAMRSLKAEK